MRWHEATELKFGVSAALPSTEGRPAWAAIHVQANKSPSQKKLVPHFKPGKSLRESVDEQLPVEDSLEGPIDGDAEVLVISAPR